MRDRIVIAPYDREWPHRFEAERALLERVLAPWLEGGIHHIGSTAIPGIAAKPIIDMMAGVHDFEEARAAIDPLREQAYVYAPHRPGIAHHFVKPSPRLSEYGLHLTEPGSDLWRERLAFRDSLRNDADLAAEYKSLKVRLAAEHQFDVVAYTQGKRDFVVRVLALNGCSQATAEQPQGRLSANARQLGTLARAAQTTACRGPCSSQPGARRRPRSRSIYVHAREGLNVEPCGHRHARREGCAHRQLLSQARPQSGCSPLTERQACRCARQHPPTLAPGIQWAERPKSGECHDPSRASPPRASGDP